MHLSGSRPSSNDAFARVETSFACTKTRITVLELVAQHYLPPLDVLRLAATSRELQDVSVVERGRMAMQAQMHSTARAWLRRTLPTLASMAEAVAATEIARAVPAGYVRLEAGNFLMGGPADDAEPSGNAALRPVTVQRPFYLKQTPVTQAEFQARMGFNPSYFVDGVQAAQRPVEQVSFWQALAYCNALSVHENLPPAYDLQQWDGQEAFPGAATFTLTDDERGYRLPTEAEWEYAARAGSTSTRYGDLDAVAWHADNAGGTTHPVGQKEANAWGLYDMLGEVWEWASDRYGAPPSPAARAGAGAYSGVSRAIRGGGWGTQAADVRATCRYGSAPWVSGRDLGFRPARWASG